MKAAVVPAKSSSWQIQDVPQPQRDLAKSWRPCWNRMDSNHVRALRMVPARAQNVLSVSEKYGPRCTRRPRRVHDDERRRNLPDSGQGFLRAGGANRLRGVHSGMRWGDPKPHERVAVLGIGGLGHLAVQYAKATGFETIAISHSPDKDKMIRELGADEIVRDGKGLAEAGGADVILSTSNSTKSMVNSIQGLRTDGS
jgi:Zinc-binding dehydrogenase